MIKEIKSYDFIDKNGREICIDGRAGRKVSEKIGEAYGFFYYQGKSEDIENVLPDIRSGTETPTELSLELIEGVDKLTTWKNKPRIHKSEDGKYIVDMFGDSDLEDIIQRAKNQHMSHALKANMPNSGNRKVAGFLGNVMNGIYTSLYGKEEPFYAGIVYKRGEKYVFRGD